MTPPGSACVRSSARSKGAPATGGVEFLAGDRVDIVPAETPPRGGTVVALIGIEPEPLYLVELAEGGRIDASESRLRRTK